MTQSNETPTVENAETPSTPTQTAPATSPPPLTATLEQIQTACEGADSDFVVGQLQNKATVQQAQSAWIAEQNTRIAPYFTR